MTFRNSSKFKIRVSEDDRPDLLLTDQIEYQRFEKLNQRVTIITILIPILIGIMIFIGYRGIQEMVSQTQDTGAKELTSLAQSLESNISNISIKQAKLEEALAGKFADQEKIEAAVQHSIKKGETAVQDSVKKMEATVQDSIKKIETSLAAIQAGKADKKDIAGEISGMDNKLAAVQKDLKTGLEKLHADIKSVEKKMSDEFAKSFETVNNVTTSVAECQADIGLLSAEKADKKATEIVLKNHEKRLQDQTNQLLRNLESKMESINASIAELEKIKSALEKNPSLPVPRKLPAGSPAPRSSISKNSGKPDSGTIHEEMVPE
jgi:chromosome segregation ATPase